MTDNESLFANVPVDLESTGYTGEGEYVSYTDLYGASHRVFAQFSF